MRWKTKEQPKSGQMREKSGFAFFPTEVEKNRWVWFEKYTRTEIYRYDSWSGNCGWELYVPIFAPPFPKSGGSVIKQPKRK